MLSRVANSIYWTNRYMERVENYARFVGVNLNLALDLPPNVEEQWDPLLVATADHNTFYNYYDRPTREDVIDFMTFDKRNPNSIVSCLQSARENARTIRETISREMWESINSLYLRLQNVSATKAVTPVEKMQAFFEEIKNSCLLYHGIVDSTFTRNEAWHFGRLGRFMERADKGSRFLDVKYFTLVQDTEKTNYTLELMISSAVLKSVSAYNMFRQTRMALNRSNVASFLILDRHFPRAIIYSLLQAEISLYAIGGSTPSNGASNPAEKALSKLRSEMEYNGEEEIFKNSLHHYLDLFQTRNNEVDKAIYNTYFGLKPTQEQLMSSQTQSQQA
jgi:uncharacterized alpha-E superfamily protein